ncbi:hypothetical protein AB5I41_09525 [Sphingomonas sp. MMS24-JH45]
MSATGGVAALGTVYGGGVGAADRDIGRRTARRAFGGAGVIEGSGALHLGDVRAAGELTIRAGAATGTTLTGGAGTTLTSASADVRAAVAGGDILITTGGSASIGSVSAGGAGDCGAVARGGDIGEHGQRCDGRGRCNRGQTGDGGAGAEPVGERRRLDARERFGRRSRGRACGRHSVDHLGRREALAIAAETRPLERRRAREGRSARRSASASIGQASGELLALTASTGTCDSTRGW